MTSMRRLLLLLLCAGLLPACAPASREKAGLVRVRVETPALARAYQGRRFALLVGIASFQDERWRGLRYTEKDAEDLAQALRDPARGGFDEVTVLTGPGRTRREDVLGALAALRARATQPEDVVLVYFSSHGTLARDARGELRRYLVTQDADFHRVAQTALGMDALKEELERLPSRRRVLVLATCHSGTGKSLLPPDVLAELSRTKSAFPLRPLEEDSRASLVLSASDWGEAAREDDALQNDIYTHYLVEGLDGRADRNLDGAVSATEAHDWARRRTWAFTGGRQRPSAEILETGADPVILSGHVAQTGQPELFSYSPRLEGFTLKVDGAETAELPGGAAVTPGTRRVELTKGGEVLVRTELTVQPGERLDVAGLLARATAPRHAVALVGGAFGFVDAASRRELLPAAWMAGASLRMDDALLPGLGLWLDVTGSAGRQQLLLGQQAGVPFHYSAVSLGASAPFGMEWGRWRLLTGPRVGALWLQRTFALSAYAGTQHSLTVTPGWMAGVVWSPVERLEVSAQGHLMMTYVLVDGTGRALGFAGGWAGAGWRF